MIKITSFNLLFFVSIFTFAQTNDRDHKTFDNINSSYRLPLSRDGLTESFFKLKARVYIERFGTYSKIILSISSVQSTPSNADPSYLYSYNFQGKMYGDQHVGRDIFVPIKGRPVEYEVIVKYGSQSWTKDYTVNLSSIIGEVEKDANAANVAVWIKVSAVSFSGTSAIENKLRAQLLASQNAKNTSTASTSTPPSGNTPTIPNVNTNTNKAPANSVPKQENTAKPAATDAGSIKDIRAGSSPEKLYASESSSAAKNQGTKTASASTAAARPPANSKYYSVDRSKLPALARDNEGNYWQKDSNNDYTKITEAEYNALKKAEADNKEAARVAEFEAGQQKAKEAFDANKGEAGTTTGATKPWLIDPSTLTSAPSSTGSTDKFSRTVDAVSSAVSIINMLIPAKKQMSIEEMLAADDRDMEVRKAEERVKKEAEEAKAAEAAEREARREAERERAEAERRAREALIASRESVFSPYSKGTVSRTIASSVKEIYFFFSSYQEGTLDDRNFNLYVSNVFKVRPYGDGTWPFTDQLLSDLNKLNPGRTVVLAGAFTTSEAAQEKLAQLKSSSQGKGINLLDIKYAGKNAGDGQANYWGAPAPTEAKKEAGTTPVKEKPAAANDYWGNPVKTKADPASGNPTPTPAKTNTPPKANTPPKKTEVDYWGNPVKN